MNKKQSFSNIKVLHFKRWSRKSYASFISLQREVKIGCVAANVSERLLSKNNKLHKNIVGIEDSFADDISLEDDDELKDNPSFSIYSFGLNELILTQIQSDSYGLNKLHLHNIKVANVYFSE